MDEAIWIAKRVPELRRLTVEYMDRRKISKLCEYTPNITHLQYYKYRYIRPSCTLFEDVFEKCRKINHLTLAFRELESREIAELVSRLEQLSCLRVVGVAGCAEQAGQLQLRVLADGCPRLEEMHLTWDDYDEAAEKFSNDTCIVPEFYKKIAVEEFEYFLETKQSSLTSITLPWMIGPIRCVVPLLAQCNTNLKKLKLEHFSVPPELEGEAFEALGVLHSLHELSMPDISPSQPQLLSLLFQSGRLTQLRRLELQYASNLTDETVVAISGGCPSLCELRITFSKTITDTSLTDIGRLKCLKILELSGCNKLGGAAMVYIANLQALHTLVLQNIDNLAKLQPSLRFIVDMDELRCLDIKYSRNIAAFPFDAFPGRLVNLRQLHVSCHKGKKKLSELQKRMPRLQIVNT